MISISFSPTSAVFTRSPSGAYLTLPSSFNPRFALPNIPLRKVWSTYHHLLAKDILISFCMEVFVNHNLWIANAFTQNISVTPVREWSVPYNKIFLTLLLKIIDLINQSRTFAFQTGFRCTNIYYWVAFNTKIWNLFNLYGTFACQQIDFTRCVYILIWLSRIRIGSWVNTRGQLALKNPTKYWYLSFSFTSRAVSFRLALNYIVIQTYIF